MSSIGEGRRTAPIFIVTLVLIVGAISSTSLADRRSSQPRQPLDDVPPPPSMVSDEAISTDVEDWRALGAREPHERRTTRGFVKHRMLHFTFDDGPRLETTPRLLDALAESGIKATFFVTGRQLVGPRGMERRAILQRIADEGHTVANHTQAHRDLTTLTHQQIAQDLERVESSLEATLGFRPGFIRPPYGGRNTAVNTQLRNRGYTQILWNIPPETGGGPRSILRNFRRIMDRQERHPRGPGGIILLHDTNSDSVDAFSLLMGEIRERNCQLLGQEGEEVWDIVDDLRPFLHTDEQLSEDHIARRQHRARLAAAAFCAQGQAGETDAAEIPSS